MTRLSQVIKRLFDIAIVLASGPLLLVIAAFTALLIRLTSPGSVIFRQQRAGRNMRPFILRKFRTMRIDAEPFGPSPKQAKDPRLTWIGRYLRTSSLDELPQLLNVIKGDMSLVGPRPLYMEQARQWNQRQRRRLEVKPGMTGLAQISGRAGLAIEEKIELDVQYVEKQSLRLDAKIILATCFGMFRPAGIYEKRYSKSELTRGDANPPPPQQPES